MITPHLIASSARPLQIRRRHDLTARRHQYQGRSCWVVKDPLSLKYYRLPEEEFAVLELLDGRRSLAQIKAQFETRFPPQKAKLSEIQQLIAHLHRNGLAVSDALRQGDRLLARASEQQRRRWVQRASSLLAIRFRGIDPEWILARGNVLVGCLFRPATVGFVLLLAAAAALWVGVQFDELCRRLPGFHEFFGPSNWLWLAVVLAVTKILHEFGHGFACKHFGGECHEMGVMLLVFTPCLYCDVSDSWLLPNKFHRAAIGAAGMYIELLLATLATFVWWFTQPDSIVNLLALQVMFICSISTIVFNGNPLLRYDGYYILSDLLEIPNLRQRAGQAVARFAAKWCLGLEPSDSCFNALSLAGGVFDSDVLATRLRTLWPRGHWPTPGPVHAADHGLGAGPKAVSICSNAWESGSSETQTSAGYRCCGVDGRGVHVARAASQPCEMCGRGSSGK